jgi:2-phospho-L-lactate guanylyltransferase
VIPVVIPAKPLDRALSRLSRVLSPSERLSVQVAMLTDVIRAGVGVSDRVLVVSADDQVAAIARECGAEVVADASPAQGIDVAVARGIDAARSDAVLVVMGDLPLATSADLYAVTVACGSTPGVACAVSADGTGTNALLLRPPHTIATAFGARSLARHLGAAARAGVPVTCLKIPGLARDIDTPEDLGALIRSGHECATGLVCQRLGIAEALTEAATAR